MAYDKTLETVFIEESVKINDNAFINVGVYSYNNGLKKLGFTRQIVTGETKSFRPIGRISSDEMKSIAPSLKKALVELNKVDKQTTKE